MRLRFPTVLVTLGLFGTWAHSAKAAEGVEAEDYTPSVERRGGFMLGFSPGLGLGTASGFPNEASKVNREEFRANTEVSPASTTSIWFGGALRDWFTFGLGATLGGVEGDQLIASGGAFSVRVEAFPLYSYGGRLRDFGLHTVVGAGAMTVEDKAGAKVADGGALSLVGFGAFYEPWRLWQFKLGPSVEYTQLFSLTLRAHVASVGLRTSFYGVLAD